MVSRLKRQEADDAPQKVTNADDTDNLMLLANTPAQAKF